MTSASSDIPHDRSCSLHCMPTELLMAIAEHIETDDDLLALAGTSRRLHDLALSQHFSKHGFDPSCKEVKLDFTSYHSGSINFLRGLALSLNLMGSSIDRLSYDFGYTQDSRTLVEQVGLLTQYISKLSSVKSISLRLATHLQGPPERWHSMNIVLLNTILAKSCQDIQIATSSLSTRDEGPKNMPPFVKPIGWLKSYWPANSPPGDCPNTLKTCSIRTFPRFLRPFYYHTLYSNSSSLTDLSFTNIFGGGTDWATMLADLRFPRLQRLAISFCVIARDPLAKFLQRHPATLTTFEYHHIRYDPRPKGSLRTRLLDLVFQSTLETLTISPEHMVHFMPPFSVFQRLCNVVILIQDPVEHNDGWNSTSLEATLRVLASCVNRIMLTLAISHTGLGFGAWFSQIYAVTLAGARPKTRPESQLHCVETLVMDNGEWGFSGSVLHNCMPRWLLLFPNLRLVMLRGKGKPDKYIVGEDDDTTAFVHDLKEACPHIHIEYSRG